VSAVFFIDSGPPSAPKANVSHPGVLSGNAFRENPPILFSLHFFPAKAGYNIRTESGTDGIMKRLAKSSWRYWCVRIARHHGDPEYISRGMAVGIFCAFATPVMQMLIAVGLAFLVRGAKIPAALGTWLSNWITTPLLLPFQCYLGRLVWGKPLSRVRINEMIQALSDTSSVKEFFQTFIACGNDIIASFLIGGVLLGLLLAGPGYFITLAVVRRYRKEKIRRKMANLHPDRTVQP